MILGWRQDFEERAMANGAIAINASLTTTDIAAEIMQYIRPAKPLISIKLPEIILPEVGLGSEIALGDVG